MGSTNYFNTFIEIATDCPANAGEIPPVRGNKKSVANLQYDILIGNPYRFTSDDILFSVFATRKEIPENEMEKQRQLFFSKGQPCFRSSPLTKRYGWGIHNNAEGKIAMYGAETRKYETFAKSRDMKVIKAMRSKRG